MTVSPDLESWPGGDGGRLNLVGRTTSEIAAVVADVVDRGFRSQQIASWIIDRNAASFDEMSNLPKDLRLRLAALFTIDEPEVLDVVESADGSRKYLFGLEDSSGVEGVTMYEGGKATMCLSSQAGCAVGCTFCVTGAFGAGRNLDAAEIVGQYRAMRRGLDTGVERVNLVFMGMGEPLLNIEQLGRSLDVLSERVSLKRITVSSAGILPGIRWLAARSRRPKLAISLNAPDQNRREMIMPIARRYPLDDLFAEIRAFPLEPGRRITFEYVLIRGFNDSTADAGALADLVRGLPSKINVIPLNEDEEHFPELRRPEVETIDAFAASLRDCGLTVTVRWSRGADVAAACGQLRGRQTSRAR
jgi:23S rRNA (adenine2503-C2)-methyltransferase